jgi:phosphate-selective porin OprO/OprP
MARPWSNAGAGSALRSLTIGIAVVDGELPDGLYSLRGKTVTGSPLREAVYVGGRRQRLGAELQWRQGPVAAQGEFIRARDQRRGQGLDNEDLPSAVADGWYLSGTWIVTGERKRDAVRPAMSVLNGGVGALELAVRVERFALVGDRSFGASTLSPRDALIAARGDTVWTTGLNWYLSDDLKLQANLIREERSAGAVAVPGQDVVWSRAFRAQFGF